VRKVNRATGDDKAPGAVVVACFQVVVFQVDPEDALLECVDGECLGLEELVGDDGVPVCAVHEDTLDLGRLELVGRGARVGEEEEAGGRVEGDRGGREYVGC